MNLKGSHLLTLRVFFPPAVHPLHPVCRRFRGTVDHEKEPHATGDHESPLGIMVCFFFGRNHQALAFLLPGFTCTRRLAAVQGTDCTTSRHSPTHTIRAHCILPRHITGKFKQDQGRQAEKITKTILTFVKASLKISRHLCDCINDLNQYVVQTMDSVHIFCSPRCI